MGGPGSGRPATELTEADIDFIHDCLDEKHLTIGETAGLMGISPTKLSDKLREIRDEEGLILQYREVQSLELTKLQSMILSAITQEKIDAAPLRDLAFVYKVLKDKELVVDGKPNEIKGLVGYLVHLEKEEAKQKQLENSDGAPAIVDADYKVIDMTELDRLTEAALKDETGVFQSTGTEET